MSAPASRVVFVDLLRFVAALQMLQGHTIAALLAPEHRSGPVYALWSFARGLTSVGFLFAAGLSFYFATERERTPDAARARLRSVRAASLIGLGYLLHLPVAAVFSADYAARLRSLHEFAAVDVLQCIGVSLLALEGVRLLSRAPHVRALMAAALACGLLALTPLTTQLGPEHGLRPLLAYLTPRLGSIFPLPPWAAHVLLGFACAAVLRAPGRLAPSARLALLAGVAFLGHAVCVQLLDSRSVLDHLLRLAWVLAISAVLARVGQALSRVPAAVQTLARETLFLYVFHVLLVYGAGVGLASSIGPRLSPVAAIGMALVVVLVSSALALAYARLSVARRSAASGLPGPAGRGS